MYFNVDWEAHHVRLEGFREFCKILWVPIFLRLGSFLPSICKGLMLGLEVGYWHWCEKLTHWKRPWCRQKWRKGREGMTEDEIVEENIMSSAGHEFWAALQESWWWIGKAGVQSAWATKLDIVGDWMNWKEIIICLRPTCKARFLAVIRPYTGNT